MLILVVISLAIAVDRPAQPTHAIPLETIWAWDMTGTRDVRELEPNRKKFEKMTASERIQNSLVSNTRWQLDLNRKPKGKKGAGPGFIVAASGVEALKQANAILGGKQKRKDKFEAGSDLTLFFYSYGSSRYVQLDEVIKKDNKITVRYHFDSHGQRVTTQHYALIPLGNDLEGEVKVKIERLEDTASSDWNSHVPPYSRKEARQIVCDSFHFSVLRPPE